MNSHNTRIQRKIQMPGYAGLPEIFPHPWIEEKAVYNPRVWVSLKVWMIE